MKKLLILAAFAIMYTQGIQARLGMALVKNENKIGKWYFSSLVDANTFSWALIKGSGISNMRYTAFVNTGAHANYNFKKNAAFFTGIEFRNVGYADVLANQRIRRSTTYFGIPLGVRIGDLKAKTEIIAGTGFDLPLYYKEKSWTIGDKKNKVKNRTSTNGILNGFNPYLFAGYKHKGLGLKLQYYPSSFYAKALPAAATNIVYASVILDMKSGGKKVAKKTALSE
jgi:hypothetical protein